MLLQSSGHTRYAVAADPVEIPKPQRQGGGGKLAGGGRERKQEGPCGEDDDEAGEGGAVVEGPGRALPRERRPPHLSPPLPPPLRFALLPGLR